MKITWSWLGQCLLTSVCWCATEITLAETAVSSRDVVHFDMVFRKNSDLGLRLTQAFASVLRQFGRRFTTEQFPARRGIEELKNRRVDGTLGRVDDLAGVHGLTDYVRLDVPVLYTTLSLWCTKDVKAMKNLAAPRVAYLRSSVLASRLISLIEDSSVQLSAVNSYHNVLVMMQRDRVDCLLASDIHLDTEHLTPDDLASAHRYDLVTLPAYSWISRKYEDWKVPLEKELKQLVGRRDWRELYLEDRARCTVSYEYLCPDGRIFARQVKINPDTALSFGG